MPTPGRWPATGAHRLPAVGVVPDGGQTLPQRRQGFEVPPVMAEAVDPDLEPRSGQLVYDRVVDRVALGHKIPGRTVLGI